jgi:RimJ/RimL family protein N-acetyltransferase
MPEQDATFTFTIPRITTNRLLIREFRLADFDAFAAHHQDAESMRYLGGVIDRNAAWRQFASSTGSWVLTRNGFWAVERLDTGDTVGMVGAFNRESFPDMELGWVFFREFWGNGYATESARAALAFAFDTGNTGRVVAHVDAANKASTAVCKRLGMFCEGEVELYGSVVERYALTKPP